jgi:L-ascorbate metabolism protein UlaG (beta-lactamase superfamily)
MPLIPAYQKDISLLQDIQNNIQEDDLFLWWLGQSGFLIQYQGKRILLDPYLSDSLTIKYKHTDKPHERMCELVVDPEMLTGIDFVTSSHNHTDHLDADTLIPLIKNNPDIKFIIPEANRDFVVDRVKCERDFPFGMNERMKLTFDNITFHGILAKHNEIELDDHGNPKYMGYVIEMDQYKIYHSGDTLLWQGMEDVLSPFNIDIALLPINGNLPERKVAGNLDCREAAHLAKNINASYVIPCHYDMFKFNTADVNMFMQECEFINQAYRVLQGGGRFSLFKPL